MRLLNAAILTLVLSVGVLAQHHDGAVGSSHPAQGTVSPPIHHSPGGSGGVASPLPAIPVGGYRALLPLPTLSVYITDSTTRIPTRRLRMWRPAARNPGPGRPADRHQSVFRSDSARP